MSLLFEPSTSSLLSEPEIYEDQLFATDLLYLLGEGSWPTAEMRQLDTAPVVNEPTSRALKRLRPQCCEDAEEEQVIKPKRMRATRPRLRNKGKIEILRREIQALESELEVFQRAKEDRLEWRNTESLWRAIAMKQSQERERAEQQNKALKALLTAQQTLTTSLSGVFKRWQDLPVPDASSLNI
ncbi:hypothetical protein PPTG_02979 [Phytophthora nicotianae INRA-310]|uniref:Uncharacterized protein n=2 Tax=Phytophthora nicotianae TaxID=4792 RepID=W2R397_PHYN3|nr:hypothetical protein PPTG_02979 [Phytophthora nicotianae INRA-310]ETM41835.1 hypothetical protein L914_12421 [Phytophthora nicotianae]ETN19843.1 hypothetical protein PPTG_02979 [Phytophthora nicotianae INRA-310]